MNTHRRPAAERFWPKVRKTETCWLWTGATAAGYGRFWTGERVIGAHQFAYELLVGPIPEGHELDHLCRVRACVNPAHLEPVNSSENKRRSPLIQPPRILGERHPNAKLTEDTVRQIRQLWATGQFTKVALGRRFGVSDVLIGHVISGRYWNFVKEEAHANGR